MWGGTKKTAVGKQWKDRRAISEQFEFLQFLRAEISWRGINKEQYFKIETAYFEESRRGQ
jgi:hypothetical protein